MFSEPLGATAWFAAETMAAASFGQDFDNPPINLTYESPTYAPNVTVDCSNKSGFHVAANNTTVIDMDLLGMDGGNQFILPWWRQLIWTLLFAVMVVVATGGNVIVIWIVLAHKRMRTVTNYFLVNLSVADTMVSTLNVTFNYTYMLNSDWPFGMLYCKVSQFVAVLSICASVFTLVAISIDRFSAEGRMPESSQKKPSSIAMDVHNTKYVAIMSPLRPRMGRRTTLCIAIGIWALGSALSLPMLLFFTTFVQSFTNGETRVICYSEWPDGPSSQSFQEYLYNVIFMVLTYFLPIGSMSYTYIRVGVELWGSQSIGECTQRQLENIKSKRRVVKMMIVVVSIFAICWLPFHIYFIVSSLFPDINNSSYIQEVYLGIYWLAMSNSMYNPIIYCWMNSRFRRGFKQFFSCCPCVNDRREMFERREVVTSRYSCSGSPEAQCRIIRNGSVHIPLQMAAGDPLSSRHRNLLYSADSRHTSSTSVASFRRTNKWRNGGGGMDPGGIERTSNGSGGRGALSSVPS